MKKVENYNSDKEVHCFHNLLSPGLKIVTHWQPMRPKIEHWRPNSQNWSPDDDSQFCPIPTCADNHDIAFV